MIIREGDEIVMVRNGAGLWWASTSNISGRFVGEGACVRRPIGDLSKVEEPAKVDCHGHVSHGGLFFHDRDDARRFALELLAATEAQQ